MRSDICFLYGSFSTAGKGPAIFFKFRYFMFCSNNYLPDSLGFVIPFDVKRLDQGDGIVIVFTKFCSSTVNEP